MNNSMSHLGFDPTVGPKQTVVQTLQEDRVIQNQILDPNNIYNNMNVGDRSSIDYTCTNKIPGSNSGAGVYSTAGQPNQSSKSNPSTPSTTTTNKPPHLHAATGCSTSLSTNEVSLSAYMFVLNEIIATIASEYPAAEHEERISALGYGIGVKLLELLKYKQSLPKNSTRSFFSSQTSSTVGSSSSGTHHGAHSRSQRVVSSSSSTTTTTTGGPGTSALPTKSLSSLSLATPTNLNNSLLGNKEDVMQLLLNNTTATKISIMEKRFLKLLDILQFLHGPVWKYLFGKQSDDLQKNNDTNNEYMIIDNEPLISQMCAVNFSNYFVCGVIQGILEHACFPCKTVEAHIMSDPKYEFKTVYLVVFEDQVLEREKL